MVKTVDCGDTVTYCDDRTDFLALCGKFIIFNILFKDCDNIFGVNIV